MQGRDEKPYRYQCDDGEDVCELYQEQETETSPTSTLNFSSPAVLTTTTADSCAATSTWIVMRPAMASLRYGRTQEKKG